MKIGAKARKTRGVSLKYFLLVPIGGGTYYGIELLYRGRSHWSMALLGGICLMLMWWENRLFSSQNFVLRAALCALTVTVLEFVAGCILNLWLQMGIWDYHSLRFNLLGQIAPLFSFFWFLLSLPVCFFYSFLDRRKRG